MQIIMPTPPTLPRPGQNRRKPGRRMGMDENVPGMPGPRRTPGRGPLPQGQPPMNMGPRKGGGNWWENRYGGTTPIPRDMPISMPGVRTHGDPPMDMGPRAPDLHRGLDMSGPFMPQVGGPFQTPPWSPRGPSGGNGGPQGPHGGGNPGPGGGHGGGQGGGQGGGHGQGGGNGPLAGLPLDPYFEAQRRILQDQLAGALQPLRSSREQVLASEGLQSARLNTNQGYDTDNLLNSMAARGIFGSGIQNHDMGQLSTDYLRQNQDLANATAGSLGDIASQQAAARGSYQNQLQELLLELAKRSAADPYAVAAKQGRRT